MIAVAALRRPARSETGDPLLLTPGPLTTSKSVKEAMVHDWGSRDAAFLALNRQVMERLPEVVHGEGRYVTVADAGVGHLRRRSDADDLRAEAWPGSRARQRRLWPAGKAHSRDRGAQGRPARDARGHAARSRCGRPNSCRGVRDNPCVRRPLRDDER